MRHFARILLVGASVAAGHAHPAAPSKSADLQAVARFLQSTYSPDQPGASVVIARQDDVTFAGSYGLADLECGQAVTAQTAFRVGSLTKQFTAALALLLEEEGRLKLDDAVSLYVPELQGAQRAPQVADLMAHTSGLSRRVTLRDALLLEENSLMIPRFLRLLRESPPDFRPGTDWRYSDAGYYLLGLILERVSGMTYSDLVRRRLLEPIGLRETYYDDGAKIIRHLARGYSLRDPPLRPVHPRPAAAMFSAGGIVASARDVLKWNQALEGNGILSRFRARILEPFRLRDGTPTRYGCGWMLSEQRGLRFFEHGGSYPGFDAHVIRVPAEGLTVVVLANCEGCTPPSVVTATRLVELLTPSLKPVKRLAPSPTELADYCGTYRDAKGVALVSGSKQTGQLVVALDDGVSRRLVRDSPESPDEFSVENSLLRLRFNRGTDGGVTSVVISQRFVPSRQLKKDALAATGGKN